MEGDDTPFLVPPLVGHYPRPASAVAQPELHIPDRELSALLDIRQIQGALVAYARKPAVEKYARPHDAWSGAGSFEA